MMDHKTVFAGVSMAIAMTAASVAYSADVTTAPVFDRPEPSKRFYVGAFGTYNFNLDQDFNGPAVANPALNINVDLDYEDDFGFGVNFGMVAAEGIWGRFRVEGEVRYYENDVEQLQFQDVTRQIIEADTRVIPVMVNAYYDTPLYGDRFRGFIGGGIGLASVDYDINYLVGANNINIQTEQSELAFQAIAGAEYMLTETLSLVGDVRYFYVLDHDVERFLNANLNSIIEDDLETVSVSAGLRVNF